MKRVLKHILVTAVTLASAGVVQAVPTMIINDGNGNIVVVADNTPIGGTGMSATGAALTTTAVDGNGVAGAVVFSGSIGDWLITVDTGQTKPLVGSASSPQMDLSFVATTLTGSSHALTITFVDNGFTANGSIIQSIGGTPGTGASVAGSVLKNGNTVTGTGTLSDNPFHSLLVGPSVTLGSSDVLGLQIVINSPGAGTTTGDYNVKVPDGGTTLVLLGSALSGLALIRRKIA